MRKVDSGSSSLTHVRSRRTHWVRNAHVPSPAKKEATSLKVAGGKLFIAPLRLSGEQRATLLGPLEEQGVGDSESRGLFASALEYDLADYDALNKRELEPQRQEILTKTDNLLAELSRTAQNLGDHLARMDSETALQLQEGLHDGDRFKRTYGDAYIDSLQRELSRVAAATPSKTSARAAESPEPAVSKGARRFVLRAADAFSDCFELTATAQQGDPFLAAMKALVTSTGIDIPTDQVTLAEILRQA